MTATTKLTKVALRRDNSVPIGQPAPMHLICSCKNRIDVNRGPDALYLCFCGALYDGHGWVKREAGSSTPRPWKLVDDGKGTVEVLAVEGSCTICTLDGDNADGPVNVADAALIVQAVNEREALLAFVEGIKACINYDSDEDLDSCADAVESIGIELNILGNALAEARKGGAL